MFPREWNVAISYSFYQFWFSKFSVLIQGNV